MIQTPNKGVSVRVLDGGFGTADEPTHDLQRLEDLTQRRIYTDGSYTPPMKNQPPNTAGWGVAEIITLKHVS